MLLICSVVPDSYGYGVPIVKNTSSIWKYDLLIASPTLYPLRHRATQSHYITKILWLRLGLVLLLG